jgi:hypothetical protein
MGNFNIFQVFRLKFTAWLQFYWLLFAPKFCIRQHIFSQEGVYVSGKFVRMKNSLTALGILVVKTVEYGVLKIYMHRLKICSFRQRLVFCAQRLDSELVDHFCLTRQLQRKTIHIFGSVRYCAGTERTGLLASAIWGEHT